MRVLGVCGGLWRAGEDRTRSGNGVGRNVRSHVQGKVEKRPKEHGLGVVVHGNRQVLHNPRASGRREGRIP